jgi:hypothetical protein
MSLKTALFIIVALMLGIGGGLFVGHKWGNNQGWARGREEGYRKGRLDSNIADCVYLTMSFRKERSGETLGAQDLRHRLLYGAAIELGKAIEDDLLDEDARQDARDVLAGVGEYYWANPSSASFFDRKDWTGGPTKSDLDAIFDAYRATGDNDPQNHDPH